MGGDAPPDGQRVRKRDVAGAFLKAELPRSIFTVCIVVVVLQALTGKLFSSSGDSGGAGGLASSPPPSLRSSGTQDVYARALEMLVERRAAEERERELSSNLASNLASSSESLDVDDVNGGASLEARGNPPPALLQPAAAESPHQPLLQPSWASDAAPLPPGAVVVVFGTRPEAVKLLPLLRALHAASSADAVTARPIVCVNTGQHDELLHATLASLAASGGGAVPVDIDLGIGATAAALSDAPSGPAAVGASVLTALSALFAASPPALVVVQGDTTTAAFAAQAAYLGGVPVAHVEAGLRSFSGVTPYPEEFFRTLISAAALVHLAPTHHAANMLAAQGNVRGRVHVVGNTGVDGTVAQLEALAGGTGGVAPTLAAAFEGTALAARLVHVPALAAAGLAAVRNSPEPLGDGAGAFVPHKSAAAGLPVFAKLCHPFCAAGSEADNSTCLQQSVLRSIAADDACGVGADEVWLVFTMHRRESFGAPFERVARALGALVEAHYPRLHIVWPLHPNPATRAGIHAALHLDAGSPAHHVDGGVGGGASSEASAGEGTAGHHSSGPSTSAASHIHLVEPLPADEVTALLLASDGVITDSGGLQEEAVTLGRHVFVTRDTTERPEGLATGLMHVVGTDAAALSAAVNAWLPARCTARSQASSRAARTYGDGLAGVRSAGLLLAALDAGHGGAKLGALGSSAQLIADGQHSAAAALTVAAAPVARVAAPAAAPAAPVRGRVLIDAASPDAWAVSARATVGALAPLGGPPSHERFLRRLQCSAQPAEPPAPLEEYDTIMAQPSDYSFEAHGSGTEGPFTWTAIVGTYRRVRFLGRMIEALLAQAHPPVEVWVTTFASPHEDELREVVRNSTDPRVKFVAGDPQLKYFGRFQIALQAPSSHVVLFDDDCIPGRLVVRNAFHVMYTHARRYYGLLGMKGHWAPVEEPVTHMQHPYHIAWDYRPSNARPVDLTGGMWFLRKEWLHLMFRDNFFTAETGEDFQLTYTLRKYAGLPTHLLPVNTGEAETWPHSPDYFEVAKGTESTNGRLWDMRPVIFYHMVQRGYVPVNHAETWGEAHTGSNVLVFIDHVADAVALRGLLRTLETDYGHAVRPLLVLSGGPGAGRGEGDVLPALGRPYTPTVCCFIGVWDLFLRKLDSGLYAPEDVFTEALYGARGVIDTTRPALILVAHRPGSPFARGVAEAAAQRRVPAAALLLPEWSAPEGALATHAPPDGAPHTNRGAGHAALPADVALDAVGAAAAADAEAAGVLREAHEGTFSGELFDALPPVAQHLAGGGGAHIASSGSASGVLPALRQPPRRALDAAETLDAPAVAAYNYATRSAGLLLRWLEDTLCACERSDSTGVGAYAACPWRAPAVPTPTPSPLPK